uniref:Uncharacterized protein n=1 Tax=Anguilla anguilla TaxID=7936 RepID=A0A0E9Q291_ANGAN
MGPRLEAHTDRASVLSSVCPSTQDEERNWSTEKLASYEQRAEKWALCFYFLLSLLFLIFVLVQNP